MSATPSWGAYRDGPYTALRYPEFSSVYGRRESADFAAMATTGASALILNNPVVFHDGIRHIRLAQFARVHIPRVQVVTISKASASNVTSISLPRSFSHLHNLVQEISSSENVASSLQPWIPKLTIREWYALLMHESNKRWDFAWEMYCVLKENSLLLDGLPVEIKGRQKEKRQVNSIDVRDDVKQQDNNGLHARHLKSADEDNGRQQSEASTNANRDDFGYESSTAKKSEKVLSQMKIYSGIVSVLAQHGRDAEVQMVLDHLQGVGFKPSGSLYGRLLDTFLLCGRIDKADDVLWFTKQAGLKLDPFVQEKLAFAYLHQENPDVRKATQIFKKLLAESMPISRGLFKNLITGQWKAHDPDEAEEVFATMQNAGHTPDLKILFKLMQLHAWKGNHHRVEELLEMMNKLELKPNGGIFECLLLAYSKAGMMNEVKEAFAKYKSAPGLEPSTIAYSMLINALGNQGLHEAAIEAFSSIYKGNRTPTTGNYNSVITALVRTGEVQKADQFYRRMLKESRQPNLHIYVVLIKGYTKVNQTRAGHRVYNALKRSKLEITEATHGTLLRLYVEGNWYTVAAARLKLMEREGVHLDAISQSSLIRSFGILKSYALTPLARGIQESNYEVCRLLTSLFLSEGPKTGSAFLDLLCPFLDKYFLHDMDANIHICNAFLDCLWKRSLKVTGKQLLDLARESYGCYTRPEESKNEWVLDVRGLSVGGAKIAVLDWFSTINGKPITSDGPIMMVIITGDDFDVQTTQDNRLLKIALGSMLDGLYSPFMMREDPQKIEATLADVLKWLSKDSIKDFTQLNDSFILASD